MITIQPWMLAIAGTVLALGSLVVSEVIAKRLSRKTVEADEEVDEAEQKISSCQRLETDARADLARAEMLLAIVQGRPSQGATLKADFHGITTYVVQGLGNRISAATGSPPSNDALAKLEPLTMRAVAGDPGAFSSLFKEADAYLLRFVEYNNGHVRRRDLARRTRRSLESKAERIRHFTVGLEILGVIIILLKDIMAGGP